MSGPTLFSEESDVGLTLREAAVCALFLMLLEEEEEEEEGRGDI